MVKTEPALYEVVGSQNNHLWLEVLDEKDQGIRVSVPVHDGRYGDELQKQVLDLSVGDVGTFVLESETEARPDWHIAGVKDIENDREPVPA